MDLKLIEMCFVYIFVRHFKGPLKGPLEGTLKGLLKAPSKGPGTHNFTLSADGHGDFRRDKCLVSESGGINSNKKCISAII